MDNVVLKALRERRSVRKYKPEQISDEELRAVLVAGTYAPTGMNYQDPWIVAVQNKDVIARLVKMNAAVMGTSDNPYYDAPTIVLVFASCPEKWANGVCDGSLVLGNMMNAAHAIGLGSCWINREREMFNTDEGRQLMKEFGLPEGLIGVGALSLGYPAVALAPARPRKEKYYRIIK
ncbi:MAG: nitroreductase [Bacteroidales bacterium]|nr:nitroreductase [Bacteroidales bacterium]